MAGWLLEFIHFHRTTIQHKGNISFTILLPKSNKEIAWLKLFTKKYHVFSHVPDNLGATDSNIYRYINLGSKTKTFLGRPEKVVPVLYVLQLPKNINRSSRMCATNCWSNASKTAFHLLPKIHLKTNDTNTLLCSRLFHTRNMFELHVLQFQWKW